MRKLALGLLLSALSGPAWSDPPMVTPTQPTTVSPVAPATPPAAPTRPLGLAEACDLALQNNVKPKVSKEKIRESEARVEQAMAPFYPHIQWNTSQSYLTLNLAQQGLAGTHLPIPVVVGPFYSFDTRIKVMYNFLDAAARWRLKSSEMSKLIAQIEDEFAKQEVITLTSMAYVNLVRARDSQTSAQADVDLANKLVKLAKDQKEAGVAAGIDVTRAESQQAEQVLKLQSAVDAVSRANLELARLVGLPLNDRYEPTEKLFPPLEEVLSFEKARLKGLNQRLDLALAKRQEDLIHLDLSAAAAGESPVVGLAADYGLAGNTPGMNLYGTYTTGLSVSIPIFDGGLTDGHVEEQKSRLKQATLNRQDTEVQVEQDIRKAFLELTLAYQQIKTAKISRELAEREVKMASDRFRAGLVNSLEVYTASDGLTRARDSEVQAAVRYNLALVDLSAAIGDPKAIFDIYKSNPNLEKTP